MRTRPEVGTKLLLQFAVVLSARLRKAMELVAEYIGQ